VADVAPFWNPKTETLPRDRLQALQLAKLRRLAEWAAARSPFYQRSFARAGFAPEQLRSVDDLRRLPMLTRQEWMESQAERPPFGTLPVAGREAAIRVHTTSGTTGREPIRVLDSAKDWAWQSEMWCYGLWGFGVRPGDTAYVAFGYGSFIGFWGLHYAMEKLGALNVPGGTHIIEDHFIEEVVDPAGDEPVGYGEQGERVVTSFGRGIIPLLRYRTADLVQKVPAARCGCGRGFDLYEGGILGRVDDMKLVRGTNVYPRAVEAIVREYPAVEEFQLRLTRGDDLLDRIALRVELAPGAAEATWVELQQQLVKDLAAAHEGLRFEVERAAGGELPRFELKARRTVDLRDKPVGA
jgi:phenylacetate-coenzyme A ligase PaaK-like adenylate-forming protein